MGKTICLGWNVTVIDWDGHKIIDAETSYIINEADDIVCGFHVWLGANVTLLKGSCVGDNNVVAINTCITKKTTDQIA